MFKSLRKIFGGAAEDPLEPQRRVFRITDDNLREDCLRIVKGEVRAGNRMFSALLSGDKEARRKEFNNTKADARELLNARFGWPQHERMVRTSEYGHMGFSGPEIILSDGDVFLTVPQSEFYENNPDYYEDGTDRVLEIIAGWQPPGDVREGLKEVDPLTFGANPAGVPRAPAPQKELERLNLPRHFTLRFW